MRRSRRRKLPHWPSLRGGPLRRATRRRPRGLTSANIRRAGRVLLDPVNVFAVTGVACQTLTNGEAATFRSGRTGSGTTVNAGITDGRRDEVTASDSAPSVVAVRLAGLRGSAVHRAGHGFPDIPAVYLAGPGLARRAATWAAPLAGEGAAGPRAVDDAVVEASAARLADLRTTLRLALRLGSGTDRSPAIPPRVRASVGAAVGAAVEGRVLANHPVNGAGQRNAHGQRRNGDRQASHRCSLSASSIPGSWMLRGCSSRKRAARDRASVSRPSRTSSRIVSASRSSVS